MTAALVSIISRVITSQQFFLYNSITFISISIASIPVPATHIQALKNDLKLADRALRNEKEKLRSANVMIGEYQNKIRCLTQQRDYARTHQRFVELRLQFHDKLVFLFQFFLYLLGQEEKFFQLFGVL